jgi:hypothetical protein
MGLLRAEIKAYFVELEGQSPVDARGMRELADSCETEPELFRLELVRDSIRATLAKAITVAMRTERHRRELQQMAVTQFRGDRGRDVMKKVRELSNMTVVRNEDMQALREEWMALLEAERVEAAASEVLERAREHLAGHGYQLLDETGRTVPQGAVPVKGKPFFFGGNHPDFRVRCQLDRSGGIVLQQVRVVASREEARAAESRYSAHMEMLEVQKWCDAEAAASKALAEGGLKLSSAVVKNSASVPVPVLVDPMKHRFPRFGVERFRQPDAMRFPGPPGGGKRG